MPGHRRAGHPPAVRGRRPDAVLGLGGSTAPSTCSSTSTRTPARSANLAGSAAEADAEELLRAALEDIDAPAEQFERLALA